MRKFPTAFFLSFFLFVSISATSVINAGQNFNEPKLGNNDVNVETQHNPAGVGPEIYNDIQNDTILESNINVDFSAVDGNALTYMNYPLIANLDKTILERLTPADYSIFDMPSRDHSPINRYNMSIEMNKSAFGGNDDTLSNFIFDYIFGMITRNILTFNYNFMAMKDNPGSVNMFIVLKPIKNFIIKYSRTQDLDYRQSIFEMRFIHNDTQNFTFKTKEDGKGTSTGFEFEMKF